MAGESGRFLIEATTYLGAAAIAVPLFNRFRLGSIVGFLTAGVVVGPSGLNLLRQDEGLFQVAELGVVLFLFIVGLELSLPRLWALRRDIFGLGLAQMAATTAAIAAALYSLGAMAMPAAVIVGVALAFSSTALALQHMKDRGEMNSPYGARAFPILLAQDLAVVPLLAAIPIAAGAALDMGDAPSAWAALGKAVGVIAVLIAIGRFALDPMLRLVAQSGSREAFAAFALFLVAAVSLAVSWAGLSMALGAFLAGALLAESSYRHQIEADIEPFRGLLLGLFFISIGMRLNLAAIADAAFIVVVGAIALVLVKAAILYALTRRFGAKSDDAFKVGAILSQGGEFAFVVFTLGASAALFTETQATVLAAIVTLSMVLTPLMFAGAARLARPSVVSADGLEGPRGAAGHVIIAGFGRMGQIISQIIQNSGVDVVAIDKDAAHIRNAERFGFKVYFGDASRLDLLRTAGAADAKAVIFTMDDQEAVNHAVKALRDSLPSTTILAVAHDRLHEIKLRPLEPDVIVRQTLESSVAIARAALDRMGFENDLIEDYVAQFRKRDRERLLAQMDYGPEASVDLMHKKFERADQP